MTLRCGKKRRPLWHQAQSTKHSIFGPFLEGVRLSKCPPPWREVEWEMNIYKILHARTTFGRCDVEKMWAVVARNKFSNERVRNTICPDHFDQFRWRETNFQMNVYVTPYARTNLRRCDVEKNRTIVAPTYREVKMLKYKSDGPFLDLHMSSSVRKNECHCGAKHSGKSNVLKSGGLEAVWGCQLASLTNFEYLIHQYNNYHNHIKYNNRNNFQQLQPSQQDRGVITITTTPTATRTRTATTIKTITSTVPFTAVHLPLKRELRRKCNYNYKCNYTALPPTKF